jgi:hypothetical protein
MNLKAAYKKATGREWIDQKCLGHARKPSSKMCIDNKSQNNGQLFDYSNGSVSNNICHVSGGDYNVLIISLENAGCIVTLFTACLATRNDIINDDDKYHQHNHRSCSIDEV